MSIGIWQILIVAVLVFLLFGAGRLPRVMEDIAKGIKGFKRGLNDEETSSSNTSDNASETAEKKD
ncbi:MAG: twin-arginine translocase TatA/TatE family subunit [Alphaproteobacteria bacterium]|nr:twin-arginine translocase TatA/TatE family subunit [Alphaproteobacteria bacterium]